MTLYLIRGLPGSGKSTLANHLTPYAYEADHFFMATGVYAFNPAYLPAAHAQCQENVETAMAQNAPVIAVSNTFSQRWEMAPYHALAAVFHYTVVELTMNASFESTHGVPVDVIERMKQRWEA
jgi:predicted kinase